MTKTGRALRRASVALVSITMGLSLTSAQAVEGMWTPDQLPEIERDMRRLGMKISAAQLSSLTGFPMGAVISLGGCTASFVSPQGLVVTNHHCARGSVQFNSTEEKNYLKDGFLAAARGDELPAAPGTRVYVTTADTDVTAKVLDGISELRSPRDAYQAIEDRTKQLIADCEAGGGVRCRVASFYGGAQYRLLKRLEIRDVRLVYAPGDNIGRYGGDIDNWIWPRHTGDFSFYRAYVAPDGTPADYAADNIPFEPDHFLKVSSKGLEAGDFVMVAGYPGLTNRYAVLSEVQHAFNWQLPTYQALFAEWIDTIETAAPAGSDARIKYEARLAALNNALKNYGGQLEGARRVGLAERRAEREAALAAWVKENPARAKHADALGRLEALSQEMNTDRREDFWYSGATRAQLLGAAQRLYRLAVEKEKPDAQREPGYQQRDMTFFKQSMEIIDRRYDAAVDKAEWLLFLEKYMEQGPEARVAELDAALGLPAEFDRDEIAAILGKYYDATSIDDSTTRIAWMDKSAEEFEASNDPFVRLAVALHDLQIADEEETKMFAGREQQLRPAYMAAIVAFNKDKGRAVYPDANSSLRVTFGTVQGGSPKDGLIYAPFTTLAGIAEKATGEEPFDAPRRELDLIESRQFGAYAEPSVDSVPVNFLSDVDTTGGNSGSPTLDARGNLVGLLFDGTIESVNSDWDFDPRTTRSIHVDTRYMLWVMEYVDNAKHLIDEMTLTTTP
ncbi:MAG: S46 family peptidase [Woeseia sp.]